MFLLETSIFRLYVSFPKIPETICSFLASLSDRAGGAGAGAVGAATCFGGGSGTKTKSET